MLTRSVFVMRQFVSYLCLLPLLSATPLNADEPLLLRSAPPQQLLVLNNGRVVKGAVTPRNDGYDVALPGGRMFIASEQIRFRAKDMEDAYQRMRESIQDLTPNSHVELARWCVANKLGSHASRELKDALHLDAYNQTARRMLEALVRDENRAKVMITVQKHQAETYDGPERRSLGGLPDDLALAFTRTVQPILSNKCGNARCHGSEQNEFQIVSLRRNTSGVTTQRNLAAVLNQINPAAPDSSPLLTAMDDQHGGIRHPVFTGRSGRQQMELLRKWVAGAAREVNPMASRLPAPRDTDNEPTTKNSQNEVTSGITMVAHKGLLPERIHDRKFQHDAAAATRVDQFSPTEFNRKYHGVSPPASSAGP